ncbi:hypothetical protein KIN20_024686 [Parelaphostrongylus tenuis]|uniref:Uncharacterized protein n=1 Tax=Parelaphostrongylus tenuis TaxID=148309 RepID=A0AAD5NBC1_PARTN|nr:hypothetical protein KIN20_024686 [Parelaphostrongylus tenuis]
MEAKIAKARRARHWNVPRKRDLDVYRDEHVLYVETEEGCCRSAEHYTTSSPDG